MRVHETTGREAHELAELYRPAERGMCEAVAVSPVDSYRRFICTRPRGHDGPHAAHGVDDRVMATWEVEP